jgi:hypothetical protein
MNIFNYSIENILKKKEMPDNRYLIKELNKLKNGIIKIMTSS